MSGSDGRRWELFGYVLWLFGCALFAAVAWENDDWRSFVASVLFFVGVAAVMVPMFRQR